METLIITPGVRARVSHFDILRAVRRHRSGDCGDVDMATRQANRSALEARELICSRYYTENGVPFLVLPEDSCRVTTVKLPGEV